MLVFISYRHLDQDFALRLVAALRRWGHSPWIDCEHVSPGGNWIDAINNALQAADVIIGILSETSIESRMVLGEWLYALENKKPLIPVRLQPCQAPYPFNTIQYVDCSTSEAVGLSLVEKALQSPKLEDFERLLAAKPAPTKTIESAKLRVTNRTTMLQKVHDFWIKGVLEPSKLGDVWLDLPAEQRPEAVQPQVKRDLRNPDFDSFSLGPDKKIVDVFRRMGNELLILGAPGSGKTITLLELARDRIAQAQADDKQPIPVVFNLSSWAEKHPEKLEDWLVERLFLDYGVPRKLSPSWIENGDLLLLFDGLDEVEESYRDACVTAINTFWRKYDQVDNGIAVCSRIADYEKLTTALHLGNAILLGALSLAQADEYLEKLGLAWNELRIAVSSDPVLERFAKSPLLLNTMAVAYRDTPREQIVGLSEIDQNRKLLERYVARRLREDKAPDKYPNAQTRHYLGWLAKNMVKHQQTVFQIEALQPDCQDNIFLRWIWNLTVGLIVWIPISLLVGLTVSLLNWTGNDWFGILNDVLFGMSGGLAVWQAAHKSFKLVNSIAVGLMFGLALGLGFAYFYGLVAGAFTGVIGGFIGGLAFRLIGTRLTRQISAKSGEIRTVEMIKLSPLNALLGFIGGLITGLAVGACAALVVGLATYGHFINGLFRGGLLLGVSTGLAIGIPSALIFGLTANEVEIRTTPNQGIWRSARNALYVGLGSGLVSLLATGSIFVNLDAGAQLTGIFISSDNSWLVRIIFGLATGLAVSFIFGGLTVVQHFLLRIVLCQQNYTPFNYAEFLDYCVSRQLMRRVGGGYIFRHRMLMEHFAQSDY